MNKQKIDICHRACPVCKENIDIKVLYKIKCGTPASYLPSSYNLVFCNSCSMLYADIETSHENYDRYYNELNYYGNSQELDTVESENKNLSLSLILNIIQKYTNRTEKILDMGCGNAEILRSLKAIGYNNLIGMDPSKKSVLNVLQADIYAVQKSIYDSVEKNYNKAFDLIILKSILEHLVFPKKALNNLLGYLKPKGKLFLIMPTIDDIHEFRNELSANFNIEHINYFTVYTLKKLLLDCNMRILEQHIATYPEIGAAMYMVFQKNENDQVNTCLPISSEIAMKHESIINYLNNIRDKEQKLQKIIDQLVHKKIPCVLWGAGARTRHLFETTNIQEVNILGIVDNSNVKWGTRIGRLTVTAPDRLLLCNKNITILICVNYSWVAMQISKQIQQDYSDVEIKII